MICRKNFRQRRIFLSGNVIDLAAAPLIRRLENRPVVVDHEIGARKHRDRQHLVEQTGR
jgi:hypothetical protein